MALSDWSTVPANNNAAPPNGAPEGWAPSQVNDTIRQIMADVKAFYDTISSGTYTPTLTSGGNVASSTSALCQYMRVGSVVTVSGRVSVTTTGAGSTVLLVSLPVASNFATTVQCSGAAIANATPVTIASDNAADTASLAWNASSGLPHSVYFTFTYLIV